MEDLVDRDNLEHFKKLADAQAPKVAVKVYYCLFVDGWFEIILLWRREWLLTLEATVSGDCLCRL